MLKALKERARRFHASRDGNTAMLFALSAPVLLFGVALAIDFTNYTIVKSKLNEAADAAALAALTPAMMQQSYTVAQQAAQSMFMARANALAPMVNNVTVTPVVTPSGYPRNVTVTYTATSNTIFSGILKTNFMNISGISVAKASLPPNINFYMLLDNSPSMALPATSDGISSMTSYTQTQNGGSGCAFACHMAGTTNTSSPVYQSSDTQGNLCTDGTVPTYPMCTTGSGAGRGSIATSKQFCSPDPYCTSTINKQYSKVTSRPQMDNYALAKHYNITLRLDELSAGVASMMTDANNIQTSGLYTTPPVYQFAAYEMDTSWQIGMASYQQSPGPSSVKLMDLTSNYQSGWTTAQSNFGVMEMYSNNNVCNSASCTAAAGVGDVATSFSNALNTMNTIIPPAGNGTNVAGDSPQEMLFIVTDGVEDDNASSCTYLMTGSRCQAPLDPALCTALKNRNVKIAILYTQYLAVTSNGWYNQWISSFQPKIGTQLKACATTGLFVQAGLDDNLGTALQNLFNAAVQSAALIN